MTRVHWILQDNIYAEEGFESLVSALDRLGSSYSVHKVIPFVGEITDTESLRAKPEGTKFLTMGSYSLARWARRNGFAPGAFLDNLDFVVQREQWGEAMFNHDAIVMPFGEVPFQREPFFLRPRDDSKAFTGLVLDWEQYTSWRDGIKRMGPERDPENDPEQVHVLTLDTPVMLCRRKEIYSETRCWMVDGRVVTSSQYKVGTIKRYQTPEFTDDAIAYFAQRQAAKWSPNRAYVMDVFDTADGARIGEVNNINSAGFYKADMNRLVQAMETALDE